MYKTELGTYEVTRENEEENTIINLLKYRSIAAKRDKKEGKRGK